MFLFSTPTLDLVLFVLYKRLFSNVLFFFFGILQELSGSWKWADFWVAQASLCYGLSLLQCHYIWSLFAVIFVDVILIGGIFFFYALGHISLLLIKETSAPAFI